MFIKLISLLFVFVTTFGVSLRAGELQKFSNVTLVDGAYYDGDSFRVNLGEREVTIRLYFVDCPETSVHQSTDARRVRSQRRYFALSSPRETVIYGRKAAEFTKKQLSRPFTVYTAFADAMGRSRGGRYYGFVEIADGGDLGQLLVKNGYARACGVSRGGPHGVPGSEIASMLRDMESMAMLGRRGIWKSTHADKLVELRAAERRDVNELKAISVEINAPEESLDINKASLSDLETLPGIGVMTGRRIIAGRPYTNLNQLLGVPGITSNKLKRLRSYLMDI